MRQETVEPRRDLGGEIGPLARDRMQEGEADGV
jgi:hypothetical protein